MTGKVTAFCSSGYPAHPIIGVVPYPEDPSMINVLLVNEYRFLSNVIASALEDETDIRIVGRHTAVSEALKALDETQIDIVLVSARLPDQGALRLTEAITENYPDINVLILGLSESNEHILRYVEAGASGYVLRNDSVDDLIEAIHAAYQGQALISPEIAAALMERVAELSQLFSGLENDVLKEAELSPRELEVLELIGENMTNSEIADLLVIEVGTVKNHVHSILNKLEVNTRGEAAAYLALLKRKIG